MMAKKKPSLQRRLAALGGHAPALFAAGSAERIVAFYKLYDAETGGDGHAVLREVLDLIWRSPHGPADEAAADAAAARVKPLIPDVDFDRRDHANIANVIGGAVFSAVQAWKGGSADEAAGVAEQVDEFVEHQFGDSDLADYHKAFDKLAGLPPAEIIARVTELNNRGTRDPARKKAERAEKDARERLLKALETSATRGGIDAQELQALARIDLLLPR